MQVLISEEVGHDWTTVGLEHQYNEYINESVISNTTLFSMQSFRGGKRQGLSSKDNSDSDSYNIFESAIVSTPKKLKIHVKKK